jgi:hypothetical protein
MWNLSATFCFLTTSIITASAIGERQMFPKQIIKIPFFSDILKAFTSLENIKSLQFFSEFCFVLLLRRSVETFFFYSGNIFQDICHRLTQNFIA